MDSEISTTLEIAAVLLREHPDLPQPITVSVTESGEVWLQLWNPLADCKALLRWHDVMANSSRTSDPIGEEVSHVMVRGEIEGVRVVAQTTTRTQIRHGDDVSEAELRDAAATEEPIW